jgi:D-alanine-D-alanine ligase
MHQEVVIVFGGHSSERLVSVASAQNVSCCLPDARLWFVSTTDAVHVVSPQELAAHTRPFEVAFEPKRPPLFPSFEAALDAPEARDSCFVLALHGGRGEDGTVQRSFERRGLPFTGSGSVASALAFDKSKTKALAAAAGARVADAQLLEPSSGEKLAEQLVALLGRHPRWVLKPLADGSSHGLIHLRSSEEVPSAAALIAGLRIPYLAEVYVEGRELTVGVVDEADGPHALPVSEIRLVPEASFDYAGKYLGRGTQEITPAHLSAAESAAASRLALLTHTAVGCEGYSRTDMIFTSDGPVLLEINTLPGLTKASFIPQQVEAAGKSLRAFLDRQIELAVSRAKARLAAGTP